ncbi:testis-expressed sequence 26 protein-like [Plakobranchus ocellatus]|uniref:Testis-expressed sequence 26 protein-like n=1 Tax=Plakobranchus ocellatus TaxID=259542 RepID=A0AAV3XYJ3_9GAST|nr:testis-expressed sequence 26 protein-like [Plakobranchus ocellatus]
MATAMVDSARSLSSLGGGVAPAEMDVVNTETRLGDNVLSPQFLKQLEYYYDKAGIHDKARCLELITSVRLGEELRAHTKRPLRPNTAMPAFGYTGASVLNPYQTSYKKDYPPKVDEGVWAIRPMTSQGYATQVPESQAPGPTTYDVEFCKKNQRPASPERIGTASGNRNNKPHPPQSFMSAFTLPPDWRDNVPYGMDSNQRESYQLPFQQSELVVPTTRYGSNSKKMYPSVAVIPTANKRLIGVNGRTTYDRHYNDNAGPVVQQIRDVGRKLGAQALQKELQKSSGPDKNLIGKLLEEYGTQSPLPASYDRPVCPTPPTHPKSPANLLAGSRTATPLVTQRSNQATPSPSGRFQPAARPSSTASKKSSRASSPAYKPRPSVPAATAIMLPSHSPTQPKMPTTPLSVPYTPPVFLS